MKKIAKLSWTFSILSVATLALAQNISFGIHSQAYGKGNKAAESLSSALFSQPGSVALNVPATDLAQGSTFTFSVQNGVSSGTVIFSTSSDPNICTVNANTGVVSPGMAGGNCVVTATIGADETYKAKTISQDITVLDKQEQPGGAFDISSLDLSGIITTYSTVTLPSPTGLLQSPTVTYAAAGPCSVSGSSLSFSGIGDCSVTATAAATAGYTAKSMTSTVNYAGLDPSALVSFGALPTFSKSSPTASAPSVTISTGQSYTATVTPSSVCSLSDGDITATTNGNCVMQVSVAAAGLYQAAVVSSGNMVSTAGAYVYSNCSKRTNRCTCSGNKVPVPRSKRASAGCNGLTLSGVTPYEFFGGNRALTLNYSNTGRNAIFSTQSALNNWGYTTKTVADLESYWLTQNYSACTSSGTVNGTITLCADRN